MDWWAIIGYVLALLIAIPTIIIVVRRVSGKQPVWAYKTKQVIGLGSDAPKELKLLFKDQSVSDVWRTYVIFLNRGRDCIDKHDVVEKPVLSFESAKILRHRILRPISDPTIGFFTRRMGAKGASNSIKIEFEYLDHNDGAVIEVLHTETRQITCSSTVKGAKNKRFEYVGEFRPFLPSPLNISARRFVLGLLLALIPVALAWGFTKGTRIEPPPPASFYAAFFGGFALFSLIVFAASFTVFPWSRERKFPKWTMNIQIEKTDQD